jgi:hypothetical protein
MSAALERLHALVTPVPAPKVAGQWFNIRFSPSAAGGELINIGVGYIDGATRQIHARLIENLEAFGTLFGEAFEEEVRFSLDVVRSALGRFMLESPVRTIAFGSLRYAAGESAQDVLDRLFAATVSLAEARQPVVTRRESAQSNVAVRKSVFDAIRLKAGLAAERIIAEDPIYWATEGERRVPLDIPLRSNRLLGSVVSAGYRTKTPLENNLLRSSLDLETAARIFKQDRLGFFVMRPEDADALDGGADAALDDFIDTTCWKLHKHGIHVGVEATATRLAEDILSWSGV